MGGNIFKNLNRISKEEYHNLFLEVKSILQDNIFTQDSCVVGTRYIKNKESFGDMDLIICSDNLKHNYLDILKESFNLQENELSKNGDVVSFKYKNFQIDLMLSPNKNLQNMIDYFSWNDLSNLIGRVTHKHGLKFSHTGTWLTLRDKTYKIGDVLVTKSTKEVFDYMGWDFDEWDNGFDTIEDAYKWVTRTQYFNKEIFAFENRNSESARRDKKRPNYHNFLVWLETADNLQNYNYENVSGKFGYVCKEPFYIMICEKFPHVKLQVEMMMLDYERKEKFKEKFNDEIVGGITGLVHQELGQFMKYCREQFDENEHLIDWIISESFGERHSELFVKSLLWHYKHDQNYRESKLHITNPEVFKL